MARVLCVANQRGGVGKTTTAVTLADALAKANCRTLLVDLDPQCRATTGLAHQPSDRHVLLQDGQQDSLACSTSIAGLDIVPGCDNYEQIERLYETDTFDKGTLARLLEVGITTYDYALIDCPSSLGRLTEMALVAADEILMPISCEYFAMEALEPMIGLVREVMQLPGKQLDFGGILLTMVDPSLALTKEVEAAVGEFFGEIVFDTKIPRDVAIAEAPSHGKTVLEYAPRSRAARAYIELCMEVVQR